MDRSPCAVPFALGTLLLAAIGSGCETMEAAGFPRLAMFVDHEARKAEEAEHRRTYLRDRDPAAIRWLLTNVVDNGMRQADVNRILGEPGVRVHDASWKNSGGTMYQVTDEVYKWGPDSDGHAYYLVFRDGKLTNFDRRDYR